jgi:hypothetical protein
MNGLLSRSPSPAVVRPLVGVALLTSVGAVLLLTVPALPSLFRLGAALLALLSIAAIIAGVVGERRAQRSTIAHREPSV